MILARAATAYLASSTKYIFHRSSTIMPPASSAAARAAAAIRIRDISSSSSSSSSSSTSMHSSASSSHDINGNAIPSTTPEGAKQLYPPKRVLFLRHGQAQHNPRAEAARDAGCSFDEFLRLMELDDAYDAALTKLGEDQAMEAGRREYVKRTLSDVEMVVSSPLSRALKTADLVHPPPSTTDSLPRRVCIEQFREINGQLLNAKRRPTSELQSLYPHWCFQQIPPTDTSWSPTLENRDACGERGYRGLLWIMQQCEKNVLLVCHGGLLNLTMNSNSKVVLIDGRDGKATTVNNGGKSVEEGHRCITKRFGNCELREFVVTVWDSSNGNDVINGDECDNIVDPVITLEEVSIDMESS